MSTNNNNSGANTVRTIQSIISSSNNNNHDPFHSPTNNLYNNNNEQQSVWGSNPSVQISPSRNQAPIGSEIKRNATPNNNAEYFGLNIQRAISAPPIMEVDTNNIFASQSRYSHLFGDIRCESDYANFYNSYSNKDSLPTPLEANPSSLFLSPFEMFGNPKVNPYGNNMGVSSSTAPNMYPHGSFGMQQMMPNNGHYPNQPYGGMDNSWAMQQQQGFPNGIDNQNMIHMQQHYQQQQQQVPTLEQQRLYLQNKQLEEVLSRQQQQLEFYGQQIMQQQQLIQHQNPNTGGYIQKPTPVQPNFMNGNQGVSPNHLQSPQKAEIVSPPVAFNTVVASNMGVPVTNNAQTIIASNSVLEQSNDSGSSSPTSDSSSGATSPPTLPSKKKDGKKKKDLSDDDEKSSKKSAFGKLSAITDAVGKVYKLAKDQYGCRFLQKKITDGEQGLQMVFDEIYDHIVELMTDPFGNYLCQKLVEHCTNEHKTLIIRAVSKDLINISMNMHGTRAVQKLIECLNTQDQIGEIIEALKDSVVPLIKDLNGNHVIQRCLQQLIPENKQFIYNAVAGRCVEVATHKHGCCVLQRCIDYAAESQKLMLIKEVISNAHTLIQNPFGNYVVQYVLDLGDDSINEKIIARFYGSIASLSTNKFSSNVIEKCLRIGNENVKNTMIEEVLEDHNLSALLQDSFGNYVVQTAISISDANQFQRFNNNVKPYLPIIKNAPYYKKLESKLNRAPKAVSSSPSPKSASKK